MQARVRDSIVALTSGGVAPSMREVRDHAGVSLQTVASAYDALEHSGVIQRDATRGRSVIVLDINAHWSTRVLRSMSDEDLQDLADRVSEEFYERREAL